MSRLPRSRRIRVSMSSRMARCDEATMFRTRPVQGREQAQVNYTLQAPRGPTREEGQVRLLTLAETRPLEKVFEFAGLATPVLLRGGNAGTELRGGMPGPPRIVQDGAGDGDR